VSQLDLAYYQPAAIPPEVQTYGGRVRQLSVGSPGKLGGLRLALAKDESGKTIIKDVWKQIPVQVLRPFYYDQNEPDLAIVYILNPTGGTLQGDRIRIDIDMGTAARAHLTTQAATKIYRMNSDFATQVVNVSLREGSYLEYLPDQTIPYRNSRYYQEVNVVMGRDSSFIYWEVLTPGRKGREHFDFDIFYSKLKVEDEAGNPLLSDTLVLEPKTSIPTRKGLMGGYDVLGNFYVISERVNQQLVDMIQTASHKEDTLLGVSPTAMTLGLVARVLGPSSRVVRNCLESMWNMARITVLGSPAPRIRK